MNDSLSCFVFSLQFINKSVKQIQFTGFLVIGWSYERKGWTINEHLIKSIYVWTEQKTDVLLLMFRI